jgi:hypothetical protein
MAAVDPGLNSTQSLAKLEDERARLVKRTKLKQSNLSHMLEGVHSDCSQTGSLIQGQSRPSSTLH